MIVYAIIEAENNLNS